MFKKCAVLIVGVVLLNAALVFAEDVFVTQNGKKFHHELCPLIKNKGAQKISMKEAKEKGLTPCSKCFKEEVSMEKPKLIK